MQCACLAAINILKVETYVYPALKRIVQIKEQRKQSTSAVCFLILVFNLCCAVNLFQHLNFENVLFCCDKNKAKTLVLSHVLS